MFPFTQVLFDAGPGSNNAGLGSNNAGLGSNNAGLGSNNTGLGSNNVGSRDDNEGPRGNYECTGSDPQMIMQVQEPIMHVCGCIMMIYVLGSDGWLELYFVFRVDHLFNTRSVPSLGIAVIFLSN